MMYFMLTAVIFILWHIYFAVKQNPSQKYDKTIVKQFEEYEAVFDFVSWSYCRVYNEPYRRHSYDAKRIGPMQWLIGYCMSDLEKTIQATKEVVGFLHFDEKDIALSIAEWKVKNKEKDFSSLFREEMRKIELTCSWEELNHTETVWLENEFKLRNP